ncbi:hypothetical protein BHM03_00034101 [Ensete ventricosum]|nr:hypothetical protein BHM03_00034101 [Ensete ventricosum]
MMTGQWLREGKKGKNRYNTEYVMYDYPIPMPVDACSHEFVPDTIAVHRLKDNLNEEQGIDLSADIDLRSSSGGLR